MKVLTYHNIDTPPQQAKLKTLYVKPSKFKRQLSFLKKFGYTTPDLDKITFNKKEVILTFDDGYKDFLENALPVIKQSGFKAVVFVVADLAGTYNQWDWQKLNIKKPLMDWQDIEYILKQGVEIGSHTLTHPFLTKIDPKDAQREVEFSKKKLEDRLSVEIKSFCYPYGDYNQQIRDMVEKAGYRYAFTTKHGSFNRQDDPFQIKRLTVFGNMTLLEFGLKIWL